MRIIIALSIILASLGACNNEQAPNDQVAAPTDEQIQQAVTRMYEGRSAAAGGGGWYVDNVHVMDKYPGADDKHYSVKLHVKGRHTSPPMAQERPDEPIDETRMVKLEWKEGKWETADH